MVECYKTATAGSIERIEAPESGCWVNAIAPTPEERTWLEEELGVLPEFIRSALDDEETSRIDYDEDVNQTFVIVDYPVASGTRNEDLLIDPQMRPFVWGIRRVLANMSNTERCASAFIKGLKQTNTNEEFLIRSAKRAQDHGEF